jgi:heme exporter protein CcmD
MMLRDFINMGGYGPYVWSCYVLTLAVLVWLGWSSRRQLRDEIVLAKRRAQIPAGKSAADLVATEP